MCSSKCSTHIHADTGQQNSPASVFLIQGSAGRLLGEGRRPKGQDCRGHKYGGEKTAGRPLFRFCPPLPPHPLYLARALGSLTRSPGVCASAQGAHRRPFAVPHLQVRKAGGGHPAGLTQALEPSDGEPCLVGCLPCHPGNKPGHATLPSLSP